MAKTEFILPRETEKHSEKVTIFIILSLRLAKHAKHRYCASFKFIANYKASPDEIKK